MTKILITGSNGQLGNEIQVLASQYSAMQFEYTDVDTLDISDIDALEKKVKEFAPNFIVNCAAYTAVDKAETDKDMALLVNKTAPSNLAKISKKNNCTLIHVSTDYVFNGQNYKPYSEDMPTSPNSVYGDTKLEGELEVQNNCDDYMIIRTSWLYSTFGNNFVKTMLRLGKERDKLGVIFDQVGTPTYARDLASAILQIIEKITNKEVSEYAGIYHFSDEGACSWYDFSKEIFTFAGITCNVNPIETKDYPTPASRPHYSVLNKAKIKNTFKITIPHWKESLENCLKQLT